MDFPETNTDFRPPVGYEESQIQPAKGYVGLVKGGSCDGATCVVTAWKPTEEEIKKLVEGGMVYFSCLGSLPPHYLSTTFHDATHPQ